MVAFDAVVPGVSLRGLAGPGPVLVLAVTPDPPDALVVVVKDERGGLHERLVFAEDLARCELVAPEGRRAWNGDGERVRLAIEARRIALAHLFDPYLAIHTSQVQPLPHQITAVYGEMLPRQPLRFLLADDPGAGKTVMAGLLIKELLVRAEVERCLVVAPGGLVEQWQDELAQKFGLAFDLLSRDRVDASRTGDPFEEGRLWIARMDMLSRDEDLQARLARHAWDLVIVDEAHRMSATMYGREPKFTRRFGLGRHLAAHTRHFLLMSATPHNGKDEDFGLFMSLLDPDRFEGRSTGRVDASDLMRRMVKEDLRKFDGRPLFPERRSHTVAYALSEEERDLYEAVTAYVRDEMNRAERLDESRRVNVGFALQTLQRRLASSPEAIYQSLRRRRERLQARQHEERAAFTPTPEDWEDFDDLAEADAVALEDAVVDRATSARTAAELRAELEILGRLEAQALALRGSRRDAKWAQLADVLEHPAMFDARGERRKLIVFSEARDTLLYLADRIGTLLGRPDLVEVIHGGVRREERRAIVERFNYGDVKVLIANDAAGEGLNLQTANLMVNYDLPWNPNRIEQRFGRIHRIGQEEVCFLWNLVAADTREGDVYARLLSKLEAQVATFGGRVFDVLGQLFEGQPLRELLMDAVRYGDRPDVRARLQEAVEGAVDADALRTLLEDRALGHDSLDTREVLRVRDDMARAEARRLQPHFIGAFFLEAFARLGGRWTEREAGRYELRLVPSAVRARARELHPGAPVNREYARVCFDKALVRGARPEAAFLSPGHPLLDAVVDLTVAASATVLREGAVLIDPNAHGAPRLLGVIQHEVRDSRPGRTQPYTVVSRRLVFVELREDGEAADAGFAPHLDLRPPTPEEREALEHVVAGTAFGDDPEGRVRRFATRHLAPRHLEEVRAARLPRLAKIEREVRARLTREINYWDARVDELKRQEAEGRQPRVNSQKAAERANVLDERLKARLEALEQERDLSAGVPEVIGLALVVPPPLAEDAGEMGVVDAASRARVERLAMNAVMAAERRLGREPRDRSAERGLGYDIESFDPATGELVFVEVKGRAVGADTVTLTRNELVTSRNAEGRFRLALVEVEDGGAREPRYVSDHVFGDPSFVQVSATFHLGKLLAMAREAH